MRAGRLNRRVTIQSRTETQGSTGEVTWTWADVDTVWAAIEPIAGREYFSAAQVQSASTTRIRIRYKTGLTTKMRVVYTQNEVDRYYGIDAILHIREEHRETHLMCTEREADGWR